MPGAGHPVHARDDLDDGHDELEADLRALLSRPAAPLPPLAAERARRLADAALRHGLAHELVRRFPPPGPDADLAALRARVERNVLARRIQDARLRAALDEALAALAARGIVPVALKGPILAERAYADPALRESGDLDLLVDPAELDHALAALAARGWCPERGEFVFSDAYARRHHHHVHLGRPGGPDVEVHFRANVGFGAVLEAAPLLGRARDHRTASGAAVRVLAPEDELIFLAIHSARHLHERLGWLLDLLLLLEAGPPVDGAEVAARARAWGASRALAFTAAALAELGAPLPEGLPRSPGATRLRVAEALRQRALARAGVARDRVFWAWGMAFEAVLADRATVAAARLAHHGVWTVRRNTHRLLHRLSRRP
ncbi:nucleotidyltransferase family protein [Anaeromyxobacter oryzae]|uniref:nucleotidyltransferase family protein n=1 Tax=Anaeromyxobacter oryzae TaxID=2918170 RepID=UPI0020BF81EB|nr:nucleotidyltransferase family protein [Anaeromyxobacter oryzae]